MSSPFVATAVLEAKEKASVCACPWLENSLGPVSLWDMLTFDAGRLAAAVQFLTQASESLSRPELADCEVSSFSNENSGFWLAGARRLTEYCDELGLSMTRVPAARILELAEDGGTFTVDMMADLLRDAACRLRDEVGQQSLLRLLPDRAKFYGLKGGFGRTVDSSFPSADFDICEAHQCYALRRNTACVFHLMRVLEIGLVALAAQFSVPSDHTNWHNIIEEVEKAVRNMGSDPAARPGDWKDQREFYSQAASHFMVMKNAWRNYTAHARARYTDEETETLMIDVRSFMQKLAERLRE